MSTITQNRTTQNADAGLGDPTAREGMFGPIDPHDPESWPVQLKKRGWTTARETAYQERVTRALFDNLRPPPRFYSSHLVQQMRTAKIAQRETTLEPPPEDEDEDEDDGTDHEAADVGCAEAERVNATLTPEQQLIYRDWCAEQLLRLHAVNKIYAIRAAASGQDQDDASAEEAAADGEEGDDGDAEEEIDGQASEDEGMEDKTAAAPAQSVPQAPVRKPVSRGGYPLHAFGQYAEAVEQIARIVQVAPGMAGTGLVGVLSPLAQPLINVSHKTLDGGMPATVNVLCIADSGERKSSLLAALTKPILRGIQAAGNGRSGMMTNDITVDGLIKGLINRCPAQYILAPEAVTLLGSHALSEEARGRFFGTASALYSGEALSRTRADEHVYAENRRLSLTLFGQPVVVKDFLGSPLVMQQGTANRFLIAQPASLRGRRIYCDEELDGHPEYQKLTARLYELASQPWHIDEESGGIVPRVVRLTPKAKALWVDFYNRQEREIGKGGRYDDYPGYVGRFSEQILRMAALLALLDDTGVTEVDGETMQRALDLGDYYLRQALKVFTTMAAPN